MQQLHTEPAEVLKKWVGRKPWFCTFPKALPRVQKLAKSPLQYTAAYFSSEIVRKWKRGTYTCTLWGSDKGSRLAQQQQGMNIATFEYKTVETSMQGLPACVETCVLECAYYAAGLPASLWSLAPARRHSSIILSINPKDSYTSYKRCTNAMDQVVLPIKVMQEEIKMKSQNIPLQSWQETFVSSHLL